ARRRRRPGRVVVQRARERARGGPRVLAGARGALAGGGRFSRARPRRAPAGHRGRLGRRRSPEDRGLRHLRAAHPPRRALGGQRAADRAVIPRILRIKRSLQMLRRTTIHQREILLRLARAELDEIPRELLPFYRDVYVHFARVTDLVDSYRELVTSLLEAHLS